MEKTNKEIITEIIEDLEQTEGLNWPKAHNAKVSREKLIECWSEYREGSDYKYFNYYGKGGLCKVYKNIFSNINKESRSELWKTYILRLYNYKYCNICGELKKLDEFYLDAAKISKKRCQCKDCMKKYRENNRDKSATATAKYRAAKLQRMPAWANLEAIKEIYINCPEGYHVDHIVPLQGNLVSGFHIENNLQYLKAEDNLSKSNKFSLEDNLEYLPYFPANKFEV